jgi:hypothetical protein
MNFLDRVPKNIKISNFIENFTVGAELFHEDGRKERYDEAKSPLAVL